MQWHNVLFRAEFEYNSSKKTTGYSAFELDMGRQPKRIEDVLIGAESHVPAVEEFFDQQAQVIQKAKAALNHAFQLAAKQHNKHTRSTQVAVGDRVYLSTLHLNIPIPGGVRKFKRPFTGPFTVIRVASSGGAATLELPSAWLAAKTWNVEYLKPYTATSSIEFAESADSLASIAITDDSVGIGIGNPIFDNNTSSLLPGSNQIGTGNPIFYQTASDLPSTVTSEGMPAATKVVDRISDFRPARGRRSAQYLLIFKDQPMSEAMWVDTNECSVFVGFDAALSQHQSRRVLRSAS